MATQVIGLNAPSALATPTLRVFADGSDTQVSGSPFTLVEATNRKGYYEVSFTGTLAGLHQAILYTGSSPIANGWVILENTSATFVVFADRGVNTAYLSEDRAAADNAEAFFDGTGYAGTNNVIPTVTTVNGLAANVITAAAIATGAIDADALAADAGTEIGTAVWASATRTVTSLAGLTVDTVTTLTNLPTIPANWLTAAGTAADFTTEIQSGLATAANLATVAGYLDTEIAAILEDTGTTLPAQISALNNLSAAQVNAEVDTALADVGLTTTVTGRIDAAVSSRMATYTQPTGFLAATFPGTVSSYAGGAVASVTGNVGGNVTGSVGSVLGGINTTGGTITTLDALDTAQDTQHATTQTAIADVPTNAELTTALGTADDATLVAIATLQTYVDTEVAAIKAKTDNLPAAPAATGDIPTVSQIWTTALTEAYRATGATGTAAQLLYELIAHMGESSISSTTKTLKKLDGSTTAKTYTLNDATTPTAITETT